MNPATAALIIEFTLRYGIPAAQQLVALFSKKEGEITAADWEKIFAAAGKTYDDYVRPLPVSTTPGIVTR